MKILNDSQMKVIIATCKRCGCEFETTVADLDFGWFGISASMRCPRCNKKSYLTDKQLALFDLYRGNRNETRR